MLDAITLLITLGLAGAYGYWLYTVRQEWRTYWVPLYILGTCLLLALLLDGHVFHRAIIASFYHSEGWISDTKYQVPMYEGETIPLWLVCGGPLVGLLVLRARLPREVRSGQVAHYLLLLLVYALAAMISFSEVEGHKPHYLEGYRLPPVGTYAPPQH